MTVDTSGALAYQYKPITVPQSLQGSGAKVQHPRDIDRTSKLYEQCQEFESLFVQMMVKEMRATVNKSELLNGGYAEEIFEDMLYEERSKSMTKSAGFGLSDQIYLELLRGQHTA
jgi:Rod binding domain-containing protein